MTYDDIRCLVDKPKDKVHPMKMTVTNYGRFAVMMSDKTDAILVDLDVAEKVCARRWCIDSGGYPVTNVNGAVIRLFEYVMAQYFHAKPEGCYVDHINHDKLDNRIANLRFVTPMESSRNMPIKSDNTSGYTGVSLTKKGTYRAYITVNKKQVNLGYYKNLNEAVSARREAETRFGFKTRPATVAELAELEERNDD